MKAIGVLYRVCQFGWIACMIVVGQLWGWSAFGLMFLGSTLAVIGSVFGDFHSGRRT